VKDKKIVKRIVGEMSTLFYTHVWSSHLTTTMFLSLEFSQYIGNCVQIHLPHKKLLRGRNLMGKTFLKKKA
jgi:hypothetical protein